MAAGVPEPGKKEVLFPGSRDERFFGVGDVGVVATDDVDELHVDQNKSYLLEPKRHKIAASDATDERMLTAEALFGSTTVML